VPWKSGDQETIDGVRHFPNLPTEETFTTPDPERVDGHVTATLPLELSGSVISGIRVEFSGGRAVKIDADHGAEALRAVAAKDEGASKLGELALVDGEGRIGPLGPCLSTLSTRTPSTRWERTAPSRSRQGRSTEPVHVDLRSGA
jgi:aminopeptidase